MARTECSIEDVMVDDPKTGRSVNGVCVTCWACEHQVDCPGRSEDVMVIARLLAKLKRTCPNRGEENNHYVIEDL